MRESFGESIDLPCIHSERRTDIADSMANPIGLHHRHARHSIVAKAITNEVVDLQPSRRLDVDVDIR